MTTPATANEYDRELAKIVETHLGVEDHGVLTATLQVDFGGARMGIGGYFLDAHDPVTQQRYGTATGMEFVRRVLVACGVRSWEQLKGRTIYVLRAPKSSRFGRVEGIENLPTEPGERFIFADVMGGAS